MSAVLWIVIIVLGIPISYILFLFIISMCVTKKEYTEHSRFYRHNLNGATAVGCFLAGCRYELNGFDKLLKDGRFLLVSNHRSNFDPLTAWDVFRKYDVAFISKEANFHVPIFGRIIRKCCFLAINRENPRIAYQTVLKAADLIKKDTVSVCVYPEGTRSKTYELLPFHSGVLKIAQKANVPIVVMTVQGTEKIKDNFPFKKTPVKMDILDVLPADYVKNTRSYFLGIQIHDMMLEHLGK